MSQQLDWLKKLLADSLDEHGGYPDEIALTKYSRESFREMRPTENFDDWQVLQDEAMSHLKSLNIKVVLTEPPATAKTPDQRALAAIRRRYRLGLSVGAYAGVPNSNGLGWFMVWLDGEKPQGEGGEVRET